MSRNHGVESTLATTEAAEEVDLRRDLGQETHAGLPQHDTGSPTLSGIRGSPSLAALPPQSADRPVALIVDDDREFGDSLGLLVEREGFDVRRAKDLAEAVGMVREGAPDVALVDLELPDGNGMALRGDGHLPDLVPLVVVTGHASVDSAVEALRGGVTDYLAKPVDPAELRALLHTVMRTRGLVSRVLRMRSDLRRAGRFGRLVGKSDAMQRVYDLITRVAPTEAPVLILGESGVGKEVVAATIHDMSARSERPFIAVNCGAVTDSLIESELFGHERGSFTGAHQRRKGVFEQANGGTLLLDEIAEMPLEMQVRLLRVLESGEIRRVGSSTPIQVNVRVFAATNRDPEKAIAEEKLREDLYYRLAMFPIPVPPLRERGDDPVLLAEYFLEQHNAETGSQKRWAGRALDEIRRRPWAGNVRELRNVVYRACILAAEEILPEHLAPDLASPHRAGLQAENGIVRVPVGTAVADAERALVLATLERCNGNKRRAADMLGVSVRTLYNRLHDYGLMGHRDDDGAPETESVPTPSEPGVP